MEQQPFASRLVQISPLASSKSIHADEQPVVTTITSCQNANIGHRDLFVTTRANSATGQSVATAIIDQANHQQVGSILALDGQQQQLQPSDESQKRTKRDSLSTAGLIETLAWAFIHPKTTAGNCLPACLLGAALVASALNIILLSLVVKSIQLNDRGFIGGKISWDNQMESTIFKLATRLLGKSISTDSIESLDDGGLKLETGCYGENNNHQDHAQNQHDTGTENRCPILLATLLKLQPDSKTLMESSDTTERLSDKLNSTTISVTDNQLSGSSAKLKIETDLLVWELISRKANLGSTNQTKDPTLANGGLIYVTSDKGAGFRVKLLEFDKRQKLISLAREETLNLYSKMHTSLIVNEVLESPEIAGSLEENLDLQTRNGNLACKSTEAMKLVSKSSVAKFSTFGELVLNAPELVLSSKKQFYLPSGIRYFDSEPSSNLNTATNMTQSPVREADSMATIATTLGSNHHLEAYNLVTINGLLVASAAV